MLIWLFFYGNTLKAEFITILGFGFYNQQFCALFVVQIYWTLILRILKV